MPLYAHPFKSLYPYGLMSDSESEELPPADSFIRSKGDSTRIPEISLQDLIQESNKTSQIFDRIKKIKLSTPEKPAKPEDLSVFPDNTSIGEKICAEEIEYFDVNTKIQPFELTDLQVQEIDGEHDFDFSCSLVDSLALTFSPIVEYSFLNRWFAHLTSCNPTRINEKSFIVLYLLLNRSDCRITPMNQNQSYITLCNMLILLCIFKESLALKQAFCALHKNFHFSPDIYALCIKSLVIWEKGDTSKVLALPLMLEALWVIDSELVRQTALSLCIIDKKTSILEQLEGCYRERMYIKMLQLAIINSYIVKVYGKEAAVQIKALKQFESTLTVFLKESVTIAKEYLFQVIKRHTLIKGLSK
jgi:hypothetical protein